MNKILVPLKNLDFLDKLIEAGADEFYMGFTDQAWDDEFGEYNEINRMSGFRKSANRYSFEEMLEAVKLIVSKNKSIFITLNSASYSKQKVDKLKGYLEKIKEAGATGVIVSTPQEVILAKSLNLGIVASTLSAIYNEATADFYNEIGAKRQILPRDLSLDELDSIVKHNKNIDYEVFLMRNGCQFSDSHCLGFHKEKYGSVCGMLNHGPQTIHAGEKEFKVVNEIEWNNFIYKSFYHTAAACGICAIYRFVKMGICAYKIVGRNDDPLEILEDIRLVKLNIEIAKKCNSEEEYLEKMIFPRGRYLSCKKGLGCYYPEVRFN